jgi:hypothetical protein
MIRLVRADESLAPAEPYEDDERRPEIGGSTSILVSRRDGALDAGDGRDAEAAVRALADDLEVTVRAETSGRAAAHDSYLRLDVSEAAAARLVERVGDAAPAALQATCVTTSPGDFVSLEPLRAVLAAPPADADPNLPLHIRVEPPSGDVLLLSIFPWRTRTPPTDVAHIGLGSAVDWAKQIVAWTICPPHHHQYVRKDGKGAAEWMTVTAADGIDLILFRKPKFLGRWTDIFFFDAREFLDILAGRYAEFTWYFD